ncbi:hypothetical protein ACFXO9_09605 [Nocardia tengchongensis]|uniref:DUF7257 domain-containing protein n=1 Tax=Nocardia tengchongensis TaxID=2055889 RepID=UPI0036CD76F3
MTSPDGKVPSGAYVGTSAANNVANLQTVSWAGIQQATVANMLGSFSGVSDVSQSMSGTNATSSASAGAAASGSGTAGSTAAAAQNTAAANSASIIALQPPPPAPGTPGVSFGDNFNRATLGTDYNLIKSGQVADLVIVNNQAELDPNGGSSSAGAAIALSTTVLQTDNQSVSLVMGAANNAATVATGLFLRASPQLATYAYAWIYSNKISIGAGTRSGGTNTYNDWTSTTSVTVNPGDTVTFTAVGSNYQLLLNNSPVLGFSDANGTVPAGPGYRSVGFGCSYSPSSNFSFAVDSLTAGDQQPATATGTGWSLVRGSTVGRTQPAGSLMRLNGVFDTVRQAGNVTVVNLGAGQVQINRAGWYLITATFNFANLDYAMRTELWSAPSVGGSWVMLRAGAVGLPYDVDADSNPYPNSQCTAGSFVVYLPKGAIVAPGLSTHTSNSLTGPFICFDGALLNWV